MCNRLNNHFCSLLLLIFFVLIGSDADCKSSTQKEDAEGYFVGLPASIVKNEIIDVRFHCTGKLVEKIRESLSQQSIFNHNSNETIKVVASKVTWKLWVESEGNRFFDKERQLSEEDLPKLSDLTETVNIWQNSDLQPQLNKTIWFKIQFDYFYETAYNEKQSQVLFSTSTGIPYTKEKRKRASADSEDLTITKFVTVVRELDTFSLQTGFIIGVGLVLILAILAKALEFAHGGKRLDGIAIQGANGTTFISSNAIRSVVNADVVSIPSLRLLRFRLRKKGRNPLIYLVVAFNSDQSFPDASNKLREKIKNSLLEQLGIDNISEIDIHLEDNTSTKSQNVT